MKDVDVVIAGGGIGGLTLALTLHQIGVSCVVLETARTMRPLGVGINIQPNAVRELFALGIGADLLDQVGLPVQEWALLGLNGKEVYAEPRGTFAGYNWPQYAVHRGNLHILLYQQVIERMGPDAVKLGARALGYDRSNPKQPVCHVQIGDGQEQSYKSTLLIGADGIHSAIRAQMHPDQAPIHWGGAIMWRGVSRCVPPRTKNSFVMVGGMEQRFVCYPVEPLDKNGETLLNWIAELRPQDQQEVNQSDWNKPAQAKTFMHKFQDWRFGWLDVPEIVSRAEGIWEYPMVDRDPVERWTDGRAVLIGDAAHAMYPHGSNGATQAIVDTRVLGAAIKEHGLSTAALAQYEARQLGPINELLMRARGEGPIGVLIDIEKRLSEGKTLAEAIDRQEVETFMARYKQAAGFDRDTLNASEKIVQI